MTRILIPIAIVILMALVGRGDYEDAVREEATYCHNVASGAWPDYRKGDGLCLTK